MSAENHNLDFNITKIIIGGILATLVVTTTLYFSGTNIVKSLGIMLLGNDATPTEIYAAGGVMHISIGIGYGILYALLFASVDTWNGLIKGTIFGVFVTALALSFMPIMASLLTNTSATDGNPCATQIQNSCHNKIVNACNPCAKTMHNPCGVATNPCMTKKHNPCNVKMNNPCNMNASKSWGENPCSQRVVRMSEPNQQHSLTLANPCAASNPCGGASNDPYASLTSLINHLFFGLTLALFIRRPK